MKLSDFALILSQLELPLTYKAFDVGNVPSMPYIIYFESNPIIQAADNFSNHQIKNVIVELAFERKDEALEEKLEELLNTNKLFFEVDDELFIETERLFVKSYSVYLY